MPQLGSLVEELVDSQRECSPHRNLLSIVETKIDKHIVGAANFSPNFASWIHAHSPLGRMTLMD